MSAAHRTGKLDLSVLRKPLVSVGEFLSGKGEYVPYGGSADIAENALTLWFRQAFLMRRHSTVGLLLAQSMAVLTTVAFVFEVPSPWAIAWGGALSAYLLYISWIGWPRAITVYLDAEPPNPDGLHRWYTGMIFVHAVFWGIAGAIFFVPGTVSYQLLLVSIVLSVCCGFVWSLSASRTSFAFVSIPMLAPLTVRLLLEGGLLPAVAAATLLVAMPATIVASRRAQASVFAGLERDVAHNLVVEELARTSAALHAALANLHEGFCVVAPDGTLSFFNERLERELEVPDHLKQAGTKIGDILLYLAARGEFGEDGRQRIRRWLATEFLVHMDRPYHHQHTRPDGSVISIHAQPMPDGSQVVTLTDVTETFRTAERVERAHRMESLGSLAGGIAHSLNNVLVPILTLSGRLLRETPADSKNHERLGVVMQSAERARNLVSRILAFSRSGEHALELMDIHTLISETIELLRESVPTSLTIEKRLDPETGKVMADPTQTEMMVLNLVSNAVDAMEGKPNVLEIGLAPVELDQSAAREMPGVKPGAYAKLTVTDHGVGIPEGIIDRIFDPFFTTKTVGEGTGLGLSVAHGIVTAHGGGIRVHSELGKGSTFEVFLPLATQLSEQPARA